MLWILPKFTFHIYLFRSPFKIEQFLKCATTFSLVVRTNAYLMARQSKLLLFSLCFEVLDFEKEFSKGRPHCADKVARGRFECYFCKRSQVYIKFVHNQLNLLTIAHSPSEMNGWMTDINANALYSNVLLLVWWKFPT